MKSIEVKEVKAFTLVKMMSGLYLVFGLVIGIIFTLGGFFLKAPFRSENPFGYMAILIMPILYCLVGGLSAFLLASLYNLFAKWIGGIKLNIETSEDIQK